MKKAIAFSILLVTQITFAQFKNFKINTQNNNVEAVKMHSDISTLTITEIKLISTSSIIEANSLTGFLVDKIAKIPAYITQFLKKRKLKYTANYEAKNTVSFQTSLSTLPELTFKRDFFEAEKPKHTNAMTLVLSPELVQDQKFLVFKPTKLFYEYSKARIKTKAPRINLLVEITVYYPKAKDANTLEKKEAKSSALIIPVDLRVKEQNLDAIENKISDVFIADGISEISIKITEINPYKLKLEELESFITDNNEDLSGLFSELSKVLKK